ncbi:MAG: hypothetical protein ACI915_000544 [Gammaproteobacteria bacterium]|jgi:hypothetical protein
MALLKGGALGEINWVKLTASVYCEDAHSWVAIDPHRDNHDHMMPL